jgi:hypothetical protein
MFVKLYKYKIRTRDFQKWRKINDAAQRLYAKYGGGGWERLVMKEGHFTQIIELNRYKSKQDFLKITKQVDADPRIDVLFKEFLDLVVRKTIRRDELEAV